MTIAFGGEGILRYQGFVIFIPFTAIGDRISCRITHVKQSFAKGELIEIEKSSQYRTSPRCPYFGICGGCQLQHLTPQAQLNYKLEAVIDALKRIGQLEPPPLKIVPAMTNWAYRRHITLHLKPKNDGFEAGYIGQDNQSLVPILTCPIFIEEGQPILEYLQQLADQLPNPSGHNGRVIVLKNHRNQFILSFSFGEKYVVDLKIFQHALNCNPCLSGILIQTPRQNFILGDPYCEHQLEELTFRFSPQTFIQNHPEQSANIYKHICEISKRSAPHLILDLYCGFGMTTLLLASQGFHIHGIESNPEAIKFAQENASSNNLRCARFLLGNVDNVLPKWLKDQHPSLVVMNPPRRGLSKIVVQNLLKSLPKELIYISCMPSTLARDLKFFCESGYRLMEGEVYDMFPQTAHVETLIHLTRIS